MFDNEFDLFLAENSDIMEAEEEKMTAYDLLGEAVLDDCLLESVATALNKVGNAVRKICVRLTFGKEGCKKAYENSRKNLTNLITKTKFKNVEKIDFYERDRQEGIKQLKAHLNGVKNASKYNEMPEDKEVRRFWNYYQTDKNMLTELPKYIKWLETDYKKLIADRRKKFLAENK